MDHNEFIHLYDQYASRIYRFVYVRVSHKQVAEDLTSDIFFKALHGLPSFKPGTNFTAWLYTIARNCIIDYYRRHHETANLDVAENISSSENISAEVENRILLQKVRDILSEFSEKDRDIIMLRVWDGLSHKEISEILQMSEGASKVAYMRAIKKLQSALPVLLLTLVTLRI